MSLEYFFKRHPVFTGNELAAFLGSESPRNVRTQDALLLYHVKSGRLVRVRLGLYAVVSPGASADSYPVDLFLAGLSGDADGGQTRHGAPVPRESLDGTDLHEPLQHPSACGGTNCPAEKFEARMT
jgi:hypothetical protein